MVLQIEVEWAQLLNDVHKEVRSLLLNRYVFRTVQEIIRHNESLHGLFSNWTCSVYGVTNAIAVRRLAGQSHKKDDVNLDRLLRLMSSQPDELWQRFDQYFPDEYSVHRDAARQSSHDDTKCQVEACRRMISEDRKKLTRAVEKTLPFASKRAAHNNPAVPVHTDFDNLDEAIDTVKTLTEKYLLIVLETKHDLRKDIEPHKGWDKIFLEPWATPEILALPLGDTVPPRNKG